MRTGLVFVVFPTEGGGSAAKARRRGSFSEEVSSECLFISPSACGFPHPRAGYFSLAGKVPKRALGRPQAPTFPGPPRPGPGRPWTPFCLIGRLPGRYPVATEILQGLRLPRNRCGDYFTSPDGPRAEGHFCFVDGSRSVSKRRRPFDTQKKIHLSLQKGASRSWTSSLPQIRSPEDGVSQWHLVIKSNPDRLDKQWGSGVAPAVFSPIFGRPKMGPSETKQRRGPLQASSEN